MTPAVKDLTGAINEHGCYICEDNLTLGLMMDDEAYQLSPGFWKRIPRARCSSTDAQEVPLIGKATFENRNRELGLA